MFKILVPVDGSTAALRAVEYAIKVTRGCPGGQILLVNVQPPVDAWELRSHLRPAEIEAIQETRGGDVLASARELLNAAQVPYTPEVLLGPVADTLITFAREQGCDQIVMGNRGESMLQEVVLGSVAHDVLRITALPVTFVK
jgi:nucleotide-binding universal stress UspA family protein